MNQLERDILIAQTGGVEPRLSVCTDTRIDTGRWWRQSPLWICVTDSEVVVLAAKRRHYAQRFPIGHCRNSRYCHTTGELVIGAGDLRFSRLSMSPMEALRVLDALDEADPRMNKSNSNATEDNRA